MFQQAAQTTTEVVRTVNVIDWTPIILSAIVNLTGIIGAVTVLIAVLKGHFRVLGEKVDGHFTKLIDGMANAKTLEGKLDGLVAAKENEPAPVASRPPGVRRRDDA